MQPPKEPIRSTHVDGTDDFSSSDNTTNNDDKNRDYGISGPPISGNAAPDIQNIDRDVRSLPQITSGFHMPTEVLGTRRRTQSISSDLNSGSVPKKPIALANLNKESRKRSFLAVKALQSPAAMAATAKEIAACSNSAELDNIAIDSSMFTTLVYRGMEVVFAHVTSYRAIVGLCSRTNFLFQKLNLASEAPVVSITSNSSTGVLIVGHSDGVIQTYRPVQTDPINFEEKDTPQHKAFFGKFRWKNSVTVNSAKVFYNQFGGRAIKFCDRRQGKAGELMDISSSYDHKILVAHRQQLAVFEIFPPTTSNAATLLWTTMLPSKVVTAKISGDGQAVVAVINQPNDENNYGVITFLHDKDDGSGVSGSSNSVTKISSPSTGVSRESLISAKSAGMVFKPGPFLEHATAVTRLSFRGLGHVTPSANPEETDGNDLLLTYCKEDSSARIFNQNSWRELMRWDTPPNSRADWIRGSSAFSLGDLESQTKSSSNRIIRNGRSRPGSVSSELSSATGSISSGLLPVEAFRSSGTGSPTSDAGAWIAEITFRGAYPALRLSRLSYMKRGNDDSQPAHFESIAAILPAGSIVASSVLHADDMGLSIQGIWPVWNPWLSEPSGNDFGSGGSAMKFLGLSSVPPPRKSQGSFGEYYSGGTHSPPTELRLMASHPKNDHVVLMDFPLWGEDEFGAMELGSPIRNVLALSAVCSLQNKREKSSLIETSMEYESSRLSAEIEPSGRSISLFWRKDGCMSTYSTQWEDESSVFCRKSEGVITPDSPDLLLDMSLVPVPLALPQLKLPMGTTTINEDTIIAIKWWPDDSFGGPPLLVAVTKSRTLLVYEIPPPLFALEPTMPNFDSNIPQSSISSGTGLYDTAIAEDASDDDESRTIIQNYEVLITPHPDFGLGLRLESPMDGLPAIAGSFKKNPLNNGILPAEKTGMIQLGDELLSVNGVNLENKTFDDIIATVRHVGAELRPGKPLKMTFRPVPLDRSRKNSAVVQESFSARSSDISNSSQNYNEKKSDHSLQRGNSRDTASLAAMLFSNSAEAQQEFGRVIAVLRKAVSSIDGVDFVDRFIILPWNKGTETSHRRIRAAALMLHASVDKVQVRRIELPTRMGLDKVQNYDLGEIDFLHNKNDKRSEGCCIRKISYVECIGDRWCFAVSDSLGGLSLLYLRLSERKNRKGDRSSFVMSHEQFKIADVGSDLCNYQLYSSCSSFLAMIQRSENPRRTIKILHSRPDLSPNQFLVNNTTENVGFDREYYESTITVDPSENKSELIDLCFLKTGYLEAFPTIIAFLTSESVIYQRRGGSKKWTPIIRLSYPAVCTSCTKFDFNHCFGKISGNRPLNAYPHLLRLIRATLSSYDEEKYIKSDWHPETIFTLLCLEGKGAKYALTGEIRRILLFLSDKITGSPDDNFSSNVPLLVAPFASWGNEVFNVPLDPENDKNYRRESSSNITAFTRRGGVKNSNLVDNENRKLGRLYDALQNHLQISLTDRSASSIPEVLSKMHRNELRTLQAILNVSIEPPKYGKFDSLSQLTLTIYSIHKEFKNIDKEEEKSGSNFSISAPAFHVKRQLKSESDRPKLLPQNASAGCLAALLSDYQELMIDTIRQPGDKIDWSTARNLRIPFWLRSDEKLRKVSEEIGQKTYRQSKDILKAAIFFIIAGKKMMLKNLAAADSSSSGRKFHKFLTSYDFSSKRGRVAAEKNAFSLLRKNQYDSASAFFLLAEPPILKSAVETIATKMEDFDLAFLVARLVGNSSSSSSGQSVGMGFGGISGGGGGFAGSGSPMAEVRKDKEIYQDWKRIIGSVAKSLIVDRGLPNTNNDACFSAVQLLWLGRFGEASNWLSGLVRYDDKGLPYSVDDLIIPQLRSPNDMAERSRDSTIYTMNSFINLVSGPFLLRMMKANMRTRVASTFALCRSLVGIGIELPALRCLKIMDKTSVKNEDDADKSVHNVGILKTAKKEKLSAASDQAPSSTFDSFGARFALTANSKEASAPNSGIITSSIFDSFDARPALPAKPKEALAPTLGATTSPTFNSFDARPATTAEPKEALAPDSGAMTSSIFDSFDARPRPVPAAKPKKVSAPDSDAMTSSIFDSFDVRPRPIPTEKSKQASAPDSGAMTSSIFDSFDARPAPAAKSKEASAPNSGIMTSSIFDSFDARPAPSNRNSKVASSVDDVISSNLTSSGAVESPIFDTFNTCSSSKQTDIHKTYKSTEKTNVSHNGADVSVFPSESKELCLPSPLWVEWQKNLICDAAARRIIRELSTRCAPYYCDEFERSDFCESPLMNSRVSQVLQFHCDGEELVSDIRGIIETLSRITSIEGKILVDRAIQLLFAPNQYYRMFYVVLLFAAMKRAELAEDVVRNAAQFLIERCYSIAFSNSHASNGRLCAAHFSALPSQKFAAKMSWQIELCLWIHRGGALPLSGLALNEAICSVRIGYFLASWNRDFKVQEIMMKQPPDCLTDESSGKQLWSSLKIISGGARREKNVIGTGSGGWEFLVDCRRARATELLRERPTGSFIIRPHPQDHGVFTISFKTNLIPASDDVEVNPKNLAESSNNTDQIKPRQLSSESRPIKRDDVVQHAIIRLSDSGFRCGSFGPFGTLMDLLEAVSSSLPFDLRFDLPPTEGIIKEEGSKPSPNSAFLRKLGMHQIEVMDNMKKKEFIIEWNKESMEDEKEFNAVGVSEEKESNNDDNVKETIGLFFELVLLHRLRKQLSAVAAAEYENVEWVDDAIDDADSIGSISDVSVDTGVEQEYAIASRIMRPLLTWCRMREIEVSDSIAPSYNHKDSIKTPKLEESEITIEISTSDKKSNNLDSGDSIVRRMIQPGSGVEFKTLRLGDGGENAMVVLFSKKEAVDWFLNSGVETTEESSIDRLDTMETNRVIESVDLRLLAPKVYKKAKKKENDETTATKSEPSVEGIRYRLVDPWEVEPLDNREAETRGASIGREYLFAFSLERATFACEEVLKSIGGLRMLELWAAINGGLSLVKSVATVQAPWERSAGGDLLLCDGLNAEPSVYENSLREHLYRNSLCNELHFPQRYVALIQVELLDLKNLTSPGGSLSLTVYSLLRLKRARSGAPLTSKARTLDSVSTDPVKLSKTNGPNAPASWGSLVRFRYPLPENTDIDGKCHSKDCEALFKGPPSLLQVSVYEKKFMSDNYLGGADVKLDGLGSGGQIEEWVPLKTEAHGISWFARIRLTLRFELMCLAPENESTTNLEKMAPSVGRQRIQQLCSVGGAQFDLKQSVSTPDILSYFESYFETD